MILFGIDHGEKRLGFAINDGNMTFGYGAYEMTGNDDIKKIAEIIKKSEAKKVIVGLPLNMSGGKGNATRRVEEFIIKLKNYIDLPFEMWDERYTSKQAEREIAKLDMSRDKKKKQTNTLSAVIILDSYVEAQKSQSEN